ncbi:HD-GYP domain-containing protein [Terrilactibacillus laevilacticus]|uniref:HD-GYP domain-containing protein n=2 Tax=Terrilactibacillus laevilacticus TaxID=1380157 RepID=A0ABW5PQZ1_9BACI
MLNKMELLSRDERFDLLLYQLREHDFYTFNHSINVANLCTDFCRYLNISMETRLSIVDAFLLHDIGYLYVDAYLLAKTEPLTPKEEEELSNHVLYGEEIINTYLNDASIDMSVILLHHENINGSGYPLYYKKDKIPYYCRMLRIINDYDLMVHPRNLKNEYTQEEALRELAKYVDVYYDKELVHLFIHYVLNKSIKVS